jgi:cell division protein ZapA (FtsZ GTPase activity inhibitor)
MSKKSLEITILGEPYTLVTDESEEHIILSANYADRVMKIIERAGVVDRKKIAVLASLQLASELLKVEHAAKASQEKSDRLHEWVDRQNRILSEVS